MKKNILMKIAKWETEHFLHNKKEVNDFKLVISTWMSEYI